MLKRIKIASWNIAGGRRIRSLDLFDYKPEDVDYFSEEHSASYIVLYLLGH